MSSSPTRSLHLLTIATFLAAPLLLWSCGSETRPVGGSSSSSTSGAGGHVGGGGVGGSVGGSSSTSGTGGSSSTSGTGGSSSTSGTGGSSSTSSGAGGQGPCTKCADFMAGCLQASCGNKADLCYASIPLFSDIFSCLCQQCYSSCEQTCSQNNADQPDCATCLQAGAAGNCSTEMAACNADQ